MDSSDSYDDMGSFAPYTDTSGYSTEKFYIRSRDTRGHDKLIRYGGGPRDVVAAPPELFAMFHEIKNQFPAYRTNADVMRDAIVHLHHMRTEQLKNPTLVILNLLHRATVMHEMERLEAEWEAERQSLDRINELYRNANNPQRKRYVEDVIREYLVTCDDENTRMTLEGMLGRL